MKKLFETDQENVAISQSSFYRIARYITYGDEVMLSFVDYVTLLLLAERFEVMDNMVNVFLEPQDKENMREYLDLASTFLKYNYKNCLRIEVDCNCTHGIIYALCNPDDMNFRIENKHEFNCVPCKFPFYVLNKLSNKIEERSTVNTEGAYLLSDDINDTK
mmetsp:Transcript_11911/g.11457  ORF Transcript_11911/g.11457 Transcript_11911/m.11457 type:complete len:161 (+) Transcript_11911:3806-4288(+)